MLRGPAHPWVLSGQTRARALGTREGCTDPPGAWLRCRTAPIARPGCDLRGAASTCTSSASATPSFDPPSGSGFGDLLAFCCPDMKDAEFEFPSISASDGRALMPRSEPVPAILLVSSNSRRAAACDLCHRAFSLGKESHAGAHLHLVTAEQAAPRLQRAAQS